LRLNDIFQSKDENNALGAMKDYVDKNAGYVNAVSNRKLFGEITPEAKTIAEKSKLQAEAYGRIHKMAPHLTPGVVLSLVNSGANDQVVAKVGLAALSLLAEESKKENEDRGFLGDAYAGLKTGTRWASAFGSLPLDFANTFSSSILNIAPNPTQDKMFSIDFKNPLRGGVLASTEFGAMLANPKDTGTGIFGAGDKAAEYKSRKQMEFAGSIPLTIEAGAGEDTAFQADPSQINTLAMQILATKDITYEEAYDEANRMIRSEARMPFNFTGVVPLALPLPKLDSLKIGLDPNTRMPSIDPEKIKFGDIGTPQYAMTSAVATLAAAAFIPDAAGAVWKNVAKPLFAYAKGIKYVDDAGNFTMDSRNIAQNGAEAQFMADIDALNVMANDFEVSGLSMADDAVETLSLQPGTWYHGSRYGPIEGDFVSIEDPRYPNPEGNLLGPGLYLTESPIIGQSYSSINDRGTRMIQRGESEIYQGLAPQVAPESTSGLPSVRLGQTDEYMREWGRNDKPATLYRFLESEGATPRFLDADYGLAETLPGASAPQATAEEINNIVSYLANPEQINTRLAALIGDDQGLSSFFQSIGLEDFTKSLQDNAIDMVSNKGFLMSKWESEYVDLNIGDLNTRWRDALEANPRIVNDIQFVPTSVVAERSTRAVANFIAKNNRLPESIDELNSFIPKHFDVDSVDDYLFKARDDSRQFIYGSDFERLIQQFAYIDLGLFKRRGDLFQGGAAILKNALSKRPYASSDIFSANDFPGNTVMNDFAVSRSDAEILAGDLFSYASEKINLNFESRMSRAGLTPEELSDAKAASFNSDTRPFSAMFSSGTGRSALSINTFLKNNGIDGWTHQGGGRAGRGQYMHRVRVLFDPMKHVDIADVITAERLPVNEAINMARESGQLAIRAGELRTQADEFKVMKDAGTIPGYGQMVDPETFNSFFTQSRPGKYAADKIWAVAEKATNYSSKNQAWYELWQMFGGKLPLNIMDEILNATTKSEMVGIINKNVGYTPGLSNLADLNFGLSKTFDKLKAVSRVDTLMDKASEFSGPLLGRSPKSKTLNIFGSQREQLQALQDLDAFITTGVRGNINQKIRGASAGGEDYLPKAQIMAMFAEGMLKGDRSQLFQISKQIGDVIQTRVLEETGDVLEAQAASDLWSSAFDSASGRGIYSIGEAGRRTDNGYAAVLADNGQYELRGMEHGGPALLSELQNTPLELPDIEQLRRMTSFIGVFTGKQGLQRFIKKSELRTNALNKFGVDLSKKDLEKLGELRIPLRLVDFVMTKVWKNSKKLSLAYGLRNTMEAQARLAFSDYDNAYTHSIDHILVATHNRLPDDIALGEEFNPEGWRGLGKAHEAAGEGYREMLGAAYYGSDGRMDMVVSQFKNSDFVVYSKDNPAKWAKAGGYELRQLFNDPIARRLAGGADTDSVIRWLNSDDPIAQKSLREIRNTMSSGEVFYDSAGNARIVPVDPTPANIRSRIETMQKERIALKTGSDPVLTEVVSQGQFNGGDAFNPDGTATKELLGYIASRVEDTNLPSFYKGRGEAASLIKMRENQFQQATNWFFNGLMGRATNILDRSPLWRQEYTKEVNRLSVLMSPAAAKEMKEQIISRTAHYSDMANAKGFARTFTLKDYLGKNVDADELFDSLDNAKGWMSRDEIHAFANALTLDKIENLLFDANARNSISDAAAIVAPFGAAWAEVTKTWVKLLAKNPDKVVNLGRKYEILSGNREDEALRNKGLMHKDPVSGDMMYSIPGSGSIFRLFNKLTGGEDTGSNYNLQAPLKGMNMVFNFTPGFSPIVGFPFGKLAYGSPKLRDFATFFLPYGQPKSPTNASEYLPGWMSKIVSGLIDNPRTPGVFGDTLSEVMRVEMATGKYDLSNPEQRKQFEQDVEHKARILTMLRGIGQGLGPSSPTVEAKVRTKSGDVFSGYLTAEFHKLQSQDYDTAIERFMYMFGEETFGFMAGKTRSLMSGVEATSEFAEWELENADLFDTPYGDIAGYFAPKGSNYDHAAWTYQVNTNKRERIPPIPDQVEIAEYVLGMHKYRAFIEMAGPRPNSGTQIALAGQKELLEKEYPGMVTQSVMDVEKSKRNMKMLRLAVQDPRLKDNETATALKEYLDLRDMAIVGAKAGGNEWGSDGAIGMRAALRFQGQLLVKETPEFARVFDRLLLPELDK
jgi:hypothetical protein